MKNFELQPPNWPKFGQQMGQNSAAKLVQIWPTNGPKFDQQMGQNSAAKLVKL